MIFLYKFAFNEFQKKSIRKYMNIDTLENFTPDDIIDFKTINISDISFSNPTKVKGGSYMSIPTYQGKKIFIQTPRLLNTNGIIKTDNRSSIELDFDKSHWNFYEFITDIDDFNIIQIQKNSESWFNKEFPLDIVEEFYKSPVKVGRGKRPPSLKLRVPMSRGQLSCSIYDKANQLIRYSDIPSKSKILSILCFSGLRFLKQQVICEWQPIQLKVFFTNNNPRPNYIINDSLLSDDEDNSSQKVIENNEEQLSLDNAIKVENTHEQSNIQEQNNEPTAIVENVAVDEINNEAILDETDKVINESGDEIKSDTQDNNISIESEKLNNSATVEFVSEDIPETEPQPEPQSESESNQVANNLEKVGDQLIPDTNSEIGENSTKLSIETSSDNSNTDIDNETHEDSEELIISDISEVNIEDLQDNSNYNQDIEDNLEKLQKYKDLLQTEYQSQMVNIDKQQNLLNSKFENKNVDINEIQHLNQIIQQKDRRLQLLENKIKELINVIN